MDTQSYDKNGNRTGYDHNVAGGYTTSYGRACNLSYTFDAVNALTQVTDADETRYNAALSCDANGNITSVVEVYNNTAIPPSPESTLTTDFTYDALNRLTEHKTTRYVGGGVNKTQYTLRGHQYDATGRLAKSSYSAYYAGDMPSISSLEHVYDGARCVQNYDGTNNGAVWHWAGAANAHGSPLISPNPDTASQKGYNIAALGGKNTPQRRSWLSAASEGNQRELYGQGRPQAKDSSGAGANWYQGTLSNSSSGGGTVESRFFYEGTVTATDMSRATDAREANRIGVFGTSNSYAGSSGRVTNEALGRDLNPLGRGSGTALVGGAMNLGRVAPSLPLSYGTAQGKSGCSANNDVVIETGGIGGTACTLHEADKPVPGGGGLGSGKPLPMPAPFLPVSVMPLQANCGSTCGQRGEGRIYLPTTPWVIAESWVLKDGPLADLVGGLNRADYCLTFYHQLAKRYEDFGHSFDPSSRQVECVLSKMRNHKWKYGLTGECCSNHADEPFPPHGEWGTFGPGVAPMPGPPADFLGGSMWCCGSRTQTSMFFCHDQTILVCEDFVKHLRSQSGGYPDCHLARFAIHEACHACGLGQVHEALLRPYGVNKNPCDTLAYRILNCCPMCREYSNQWFPAGANAGGRGSVGGVPGFVGPRLARAVSEGVGSV